MVRSGLTTHSDQDASVRRVSKPCAKGCYHLLEWTEGNDCGKCFHALLTNMCWLIKLLSVTSLTLRPKTLVSPPRPIRSCWEKVSIHPSIHLQPLIWNRVTGEAAPAGSYKLPNSIDLLFSKDSTFEMKLKLVSYTTYTCICTSLCLCLEHM